MFTINDDLSIYITRGDVLFFKVTADKGGKNYVFQPGDVLRFTVFEKKACNCVVLQKDFPVSEETEHVEIMLDEKDTKIGDLISKPVNYWYEIELNPLTNPQTIVGYDDKGPKIFRLFPEGKELNETDTDGYEPDEEIPDVDMELDLLSRRPVENRVVTAAIVKIDELAKKTSKRVEEFSCISLLWENKNITHPFLAQSVALDLSAYTGVFIRFKDTVSGEGYYSSGFIPVGKFAIMQAIMPGGVVCQRKASVYDAGVLFDEGKHADAKDDSCAVPAEIYGVKGAFV